MKFLCVLFVLFAATCALEDDDLIVTREYVEYLKRHVDWVVEDYEDNIFRGWTVAEVRSMLGYIPNYDSDIPEVDPEDPDSLPSELSWANSKCDHAPKNQGACGACWAFAIAGMLSDRCCLANSAKDKGWLSVQELVSCAPKTYGCQGADINTPADYLKTSNGLVPDACYPYVGKKESCPSKCKNGKAWAASHVCKCGAVSRCNSVENIKTCLRNGPVPIGFQVCESFMSYKSGIYKCDCTKYTGGHATLAMGYSTSPSCNIKSKNSWGTGWGQKGYFQMACNTCKMTGGSVCTGIKNK